MKQKTAGLRSGLVNYGDPDFSIFLRKSFIKSAGYSDDALDRPIVGITNTYSGYNGCHRTVPELVEAVKRGVMLAGGLPIDFPTISMHESFSHPTSMFVRNLMAIDAEEMIRAQPMDSVVLIGGCDKTVPALLMGAASAEVPAILEVTGPMMTGSHRGERLAACTDCRRQWARYRAGEIDPDEIDAISGRLAPTAGTCGVMGTASTMALAAEALGIMLPGGGTIPAVQSERLVHAEETGRRAVALAAGGVTPSRIMTREAIENALRVVHAVGGSTNALVHLTAVAGRLGIEVDLDSFDRIGRETPMLVDLKPSGTKYMEDLHCAGGLAAVLREIRDLLNLDCETVDGRTLGQVLDEAPAPWAQDVVHAASDPVFAGGAVRVLRGNLAPRGALIKQSAASAELLEHSGRAVVFESLEDMDRRIDAPDLQVTAADILVLKNAGPVGGPGMPEAGYIPIPKKLAAQGVKDMVRLSDARMSGTAFGTIVLHITPEAAVGGPLALLRDGDVIRLSTAEGRLDVELDEAELARRRLDWRAPMHAGSERGYKKLFLEQVLQADEGCDFAFLKTGGDVARSRGNAPK